MADKLIYTKIEKLIAKVKSGDSQAFDDLYSLTSHKVYYLALSMLKDKILAEDIIQNVFIIVFNSIHTLQNSKLFLAWLNKITYNECLKEINSKNKFNMVDSENIFPFLKDENIDNLPLDSYLRSESSNEMLELFSKLPKIHSSVLIMRYYEDMKLSEIASALNISEGTVKSRISNAKKGLLNLYTQYNKDDLVFGFLIYPSLKNRKTNKVGSNKVLNKNTSTLPIDRLALSSPVLCIYDTLLLTTYFINTYPKDKASISSLSSNNLHKSISYIKFKDINNQPIDIKYKINNHSININLSDSLHKISYIELYDLYSNITIYTVKHLDNLNSKI